MKLKPLTLAAVGVVLVAMACDRNHDFKTHAVYEAPLNRLEIEVNGTGVVRAGHDTAEDGKGRASITSLDPATPVTVLLEVAGNREQANYQLDLGEPRPLDWSWKSAPASLARVLADAGVNVKSMDEIDECVHVINGAASGPKGTTLEGQARTLTVVRVSTEYQ